MINEPTCMEEEFGPLDERRECEGCQELISECQCPCTFGCDNGYFFGSETPGFDYINDDENEFYPCPSCHGKNLAKEMTLW